MKCPNCNAEINEGSIICPVCNTQFAFTANDNFINLPDDDLVIKSNGVEEYVDPHANDNSPVIQEKGVLNLKSNPQPKKVIKKAVKVNTQQPVEEEKPAEEVKPEQPENSAVTEVKDKDDAMFKIEDVAKTVRAGNFKVMLLKNGSVVSYNTATGQNSKIHGGGAKDIGFYDTANGIISIRNNDDTRKRVNLNTGQIVNTEAAPQPEKKEEPKKEEQKKEEPKAP